MGTPKSRADQDADAETTPEMKKKALIIGISGQDCAYLAKLLLDQGYEVHGSSRDHELTSFQ